MLSLIFTATFCIIVFFTKKVRVIDKTPGLLQKRGTLVFMGTNILYFFLCLKKIICRALYCHINSDIYCNNVDKGGESDRRNSVFPAKGGKALLPEKKENCSLL